jgi:polysaccharide export outer membrane protein
MTIRVIPSIIRARRHRGFSLVTWLGSIAFLVLATTGTMRAQFNGPALGLSASENRNIVPTTDHAILYPASREILLGQGDVLMVHVFGTTDYTPTVRIAMDGTVQLPLIGGVAVDGLSVHEAEDLIAKRLADAGMFREPQVSIQLMESPNEIVTVTGEMHGVFPVAGGKRLFDVISAAGGLPPTASHTVVINRPGNPEPIVIDLGTDPATSSGANIPVFPRDTIVISRVGVVYLLGAFKNQGAIPLQQNAPLTLMQVAAIGGGPGFEGKSDDLRLVRTSGTTRTVVTVDLKKVINGEAPDPILQADDIVFLPTSSVKAAIKVGGLGTLMGVVSIMLYAIHP